MVARHCCQCLADTTFLHYMLMCIFFFGCHSATNMTFRLVHINHLSGFRCKSGINLRQPLGNILMYSTFTNAKTLRSLPHGGIVFNDIICDFHSAFFNICFQKNTPAYLFVQSMQGMYYIFICFNRLLCTKSLIALV